MTPSKSSSCGLGYVCFKICSSRPIALFDANELLSISVHYVVSYSTVWDSDRS